MKNYSFIFSICLLVSSFFAQDQNIRIKANLNEVTIYLNNAQLKHTTPSFTIPKGMQTIIVENIAVTTLPQSIQISGKGNFVILSSQFRKNFIHSKSISKQIQQLEDSLEIIQAKKDKLDIQFLSYENEEQLLLANKNIGGTNTGVTAAELEKVANFYRNRLNDIRIKKLELQPKIKKYQEQIDLLKKQFQELNNQKNQPVGEIIVNVYANTNVPNAELSIEYVCTNTRWSPQYEIRVEDLNKPINVLLKAEVSQNTGIDWNNIRLHLSTSNPILDNNKPELTPWYLYVQNQYPKVKRFAGQNNLDKQSMAYQVAPTEQVQETEAQQSYEFTQVSEKITSQEYSISIPVTVENNNKPSRIDIQNFTMPSNFIYYAVPKLSDYAYLVAQVTDWTKYNLLNAPAYVFIENSYVGTSTINPDVANDTLEISLGIDKSIAIKREMIKKFNEKKILGNFRKEYRGYEISVKNKKSSAIQIIIEDQIPISTIEEIEVELLESSNANYDKTKGKLQWKFTLQPNEEKKLPFKFSVKYPKDKSVSNL